MSRSQLIFSILILLLCSSPAQAAVPTIPDGPDGTFLQCVQEEDQDFGDCWGNIYFPAKQKNISLKVAKRKIKKKIKNAKKNRNAAYSSGDSSLGDQYQQDINTWKSVRTAAKQCNSFYEYECSGGGGDNEQGGGGSGNGGNISLAQACTDAGATVASSVNSKAFQRIINGAICTQGSSPWVMIKRNDSQHCTGGMIANNIVITAAHCVVDFGCGSLTFHDGHGGSASGQTCTAHPSYSFPNYDLAVVELDGTLNTEILTIHTTDDIQDGEKVLMAGFGRNKNEVGEDIAHSAMLAGYAFVSSTTTQHINTEFDINDSTDDSNTCNGDSGGPLAILRNGIWKLIGVVSGGDAENCGMELGGEDGTDNSFWTNVTSAWAQQFLADNTSGIVD
ncbi:MAG: trypsin-like serine protease [Bdellovibrionales bacterium]|nr:trypsin-like serine protease [Bdellovibrionales bacterium]